MTVIDRTARIRALNDQFRRFPREGVIMLSQGIQALQESDLAAFLGLIMAIQEYDAFEPGSDPYQEHDMGALGGPNGEKVFWKIDYYNHAMDAGSADPANPELTKRVMTIMLASEY